MLKIPSHLILTAEQKESLYSLPDSMLTNIKWESENDAVSFLKEHNLVLENRDERKWKVRYSDKAKGIYLLQCCYGSDMSSKKKNGEDKIRKLRQDYKFVSCLAFARIKKFKNNSINIFGYLNHLEDCQHQPPPHLNKKNKIHDSPPYILNSSLMLSQHQPLPHLVKKNEIHDSPPYTLNSSLMLSKKIKRKSPNGFSIFFKLYRNILKNQHPTFTPQQIMREAGAFWRSLSNELKNSFIIYARDESALMTYDSKETKPAIIMFDRDDRDDNTAIERLFDEIICGDAYIS
ncbi:hypothetical protein RhiirC2_373644, partial [Rhizophagus irregularis]